MARRRKHRRRHNRRRGSVTLYRRNEPGRHRRRHRRNPSMFHKRRHHRRNPVGGIRGFVAQIPAAAWAGVGIMTGKAAARGLPALVGLKPVGFVGLLTQTLTGTVAAGAVHLAGFRGFAFNMLGGTFSTLYESLARTGIGGKPIPVLGTALSDYSEAWRLAGTPARPARGVLQAYARPRMVGVTRGVGRYQGNAAGRIQQQMGA